MTPVAPPRDHRQRRHSTKTIALARRMYGNGDAWTPVQIRMYLAGNGIDVALYTIRCWVVPGELEEQRRRNRESYHRRRNNTVVGLLDRMLELRSAGLSFAAIAKVIGLDYGVRMNADQARYYVNERREPVQPKKRAA